MFRLGVSACLLGQAVRYDGGARPVAWLQSDLPALVGGVVEWHPVCPEVGIGLGVPRPIIRLVADGDQVRLRRPLDGADLSKKMSDFSVLSVGSWLASGLDGVILKARSPSCGLGDVEVHGRVEGELLHRRGSGFFAAEVGRAMAGVPVVSEGMLEMSAARDHFVKAVVQRHAARIARLGDRESGAP